MNADRSLFARHVRDALDHFYEPAHLYTSPLAEMLLSEPAIDTATALREQLRGAIESLRPPQTVPFGAAEWTCYRILWERYIQRREWYSIGHDLGLGRSSVYKYLQQAVDALSTLLWRQYQSQCEARERAAPPEIASLDELAAAEAVSMSQAWPRGPVEVDVLVRDVFALLAPLSAKLGVTLALDLAEGVPPLLGDRAVLHQILAGVLVAASERASDGELTLSVTHQGSEILFRVHGLRSAPDEEGLLQQMGMSQRLLQSYGGRLWLDRTDGGLAIVSELPAHSRPTILVADDDPDTLLLYQRFLQSTGYALRVARNGSEIMRQLADGRPDLIILDVLMPQEDGWVVLQRLKTLPETADIPVLIYSVLSQPSLALALGALAVLPKPVREDQLLNAVERALAL